MLSNIKKNFINIRLILFIILPTILAGCSYKITRSYELPENKILNQNCIPKIVFLKNVYGLDCKYKGSIKIDDGGLAINCSKEKVLEQLKKEACLLDANLIDIVDFVEPGYSTCYRCIADFYSIQYDDFTNKILANENRDTLKYNTRSKLKWEDLKITIPENSDIPYNIVSGIDLHSGLTFWSGKFKNFSIQSIIFLDVSGVKKSFINDTNLIHIQMLFDLAQIYSKKLENYLNTEIPRTGNQEKIFYHINEYKAKLAQEQHNYIYETDYGRNKELQKKWIEKINSYKKELNIE